MWKGSLQEGILNKSPVVNYYWRSKGNVPLSTKNASSSVQRKTSLQAGLTKQSDLNKGYKEYQKLNKENVEPPCKAKEPVETPHTPKPKKGELKVKQHGIRCRKPRLGNFFRPVCNKIFDFRHDINEHVLKKQPDFKYHCQYCKKKNYVNYTSKYKHENS